MIPVTTNVDWGTGGGLNYFAVTVLTVLCRLAYKSSLESVKRNRQSLSERELDLLPLLEIESSDVILAQNFQGARLSNCQLNPFLSF